MSCPSCVSGLVEFEISTNKCKCRACGVNWKSKTVYSCKNCHNEMDINRKLMMMKDGRCDWTSCENCGLYHNSDDLNKKENIEILN